MRALLIQANARYIPLKDESVHCVVTSPPYWGLRDYGLAGRVWDGAAGCEHVWGEEIGSPGMTGGTDNRHPKMGPKSQPVSGPVSQGQFCHRCGAWRGCLGLEPTPELYIEHMVAVFREVRRVLRDDGVCFLNLGDSYFSGGQGASGCDISGKPSQGYPVDDRAFQNLYGECINAWLRHNERSDIHHVRIQFRELLRRILACTKSANAHLASVDFSDPKQIPQSLAAILDQVNSVSLACVPLLSFLESRQPESFQQPQEYSHLWRNFLAFPSMLRTFCVDALAFAGMMRDFLASPDDIQDIVSPCAVLLRRTRCIAGYCSLVFSSISTPVEIQPHCTTKSPSLQLKPKDLCGIPWRVAFALQADGWWLRSDIIWSKPNPMPESVTDRPTKAHEYVFLLSKSARYYWDQEAVRERQTKEAGSISVRSFIYTNDTSDPKGGGYRGDGGLANRINPGKRNIRTVWEIATRPYPGAHYAVFPPQLVEPCIKAGTSAKGCCPECGAPWERVVEKTAGDWQERKAAGAGGNWQKIGRNVAHGIGTNHTLGRRSSTTLGWIPTCSCPEHEPVPCTVLDPFCGSGTTLRVARKLRRDSIGLDLSGEYLRKQAVKRLRVTPLLPGME